MESSAYILDERGLDGLTLLVNLGDGRSYVVSIEGNGRAHACESCTGFSPAQMYRQLFDEREQKCNTPS